MRTRHAALAITLMGLACRVTMRSPDVESEAAPVESRQQVVEVVEEEDPLVSLAIGTLVSCGAHRSGRVSCRGLGVALAAVPGIKGAIDLLVGAGDTYVIAGDGRVWYWYRGDRVDPEPKLKLIDPTGDAVQLARTGARGPVCWLRRSGSVECQSFYTTNNKAELLPGISDAVELVAGDTHFCARRSTGSVSCWNVGMNRVVPGIDDIAENPTLRDAHALALGGDRACALDSAGGLRCWRFLYHSKPPPMQDEWVPPLPAVAQVVVGHDYICARTTEGAVTCWGEADWAAGLIPGLTDVAHLYGGPLLVCARRTDGSTWCWGDDTGGLLRDGLPTDPVPHIGAMQLAGVRGLVASGSATCALVEGGDVRCWGTKDALVEPTVYGRFPDAVEIYAQWGSLCVRTQDGEVACRVISDGSPRFSAGEVADPTWRWRPHKAISVANGLAIDCSLESSGRIHCWPKLGKPTSSPNPRPSELALDGQVVADAVQIALMLDVLYVRTRDGRILRADSSGGQADATGLAGATDMSVGFSNLCALYRDESGGSVRCLGDNFQGARGIQNELLWTPNPHVEGHYVAVRAQRSRACAITEPDREVLCWGMPWDLDGGLGFDRSMRRRIPYLDRPATLLTVGLSHACAATIDGRVVCWGETNNLHQLGHELAIAVRPRRLMMQLPDIRPGETVRYGH